MSAVRWPRKGSYCIWYLSQYVYNVHTGINCSERSFQACSYNFMLTRNVLKTRLVRGMLTFGPLLLSINYAVSRSQHTFSTSLFRLTLTFMNDAFQLKLSIHCAISGTFCIAPLSLWENEWENEIWRVLGLIQLRLNISHAILAKNSNQYCHLRSHYIVTERLQNCKGQFGALLLLQWERVKLF